MLRVEHTEHGALIMIGDRQLGKAVNTACAGEVMAWFRSVLPEIETTTKTLRNTIAVQDKLIKEQNQRLTEYAKRNGGLDG